MLAFSLDALGDDLAAWAASLGRTGEFTFRLLLAAAAGSLVGIEREVRGRLAGFRTNLLVCLGSAMVMIVSLSFVYFPWPTPDGTRIQMDPARIAYGVMGGIGFLGAGTIMQARGSIRGLTTAAALWCVAAIGLGIGLGLYLISILATVLVVVALWILDYIEAVVPKKRYRRIVLRRRWQADCIPQTIRRVTAIGFRLHGISYERTGPDLRDVEITLGVSFRSMPQIDSIGPALDDDPDVVLVGVKD